MFLRYRFLRITFALKTEDFNGQYVIGLDEYGSDYLYDDVLIFADPDMICAYYDRKTESRELFEKTWINKEVSHESLDFKRYSCHIEKA